MNQDRQAQSVVVPYALHKRVRLLAANLDMSIRDVVVQALESYLNPMEKHVEKRQQTAKVEEEKQITAEERRERMELEFERDKSLYLSKILKCFLSAAKMAKLDKFKFVNEAEAQRWIERYLANESAMRERYSFLGMEPGTKPSARPEMHEVESIPFKAGAADETEERALGSSADY